MTLTVYSTSDIKTIQGTLKQYKTPLPRKWRVQTRSGDKVEQQRSSRYRKIGEKEKNKQRNS